MTKDDFQTFFGAWAKGYVLILYTDNGFGIAVKRPSAIHSLTDESVTGKDYLGRPFMVPLDHVVMAKFKWDDPRNRYKFKSEKWLNSTYPEADTQPIAPPAPSAPPGAFAWMEAEQDEA